MSTTAVTASETPQLPYGPLMTANLPRLHRAFLWLNRWLATPALRAGLGPLFSNPITGSLMVLRTRGRRTGQWRDAPLGYVIRDGHVYCCAGFGRETQWLRNIAADPRVELILPSCAVAGLAREVSEPAEWADAMRALLLSMGPIGRWTVGDMRRLPDEDLRAAGAAIPLVRIDVTGLAAGPYDPGGSGWIVLGGATLLAVGWLIGRRRRS